MNKVVESKNSAGILKEVYMKSPYFATSTSNLTLTAAYQQVGDLIDTHGLKSVGLWADLDVNDSTDITFKLQGYSTQTGGSPYDIPIHMISSTGVNLYSESRIDKISGDHKIVQSWDVERVVPFVGIFIKAGALGANAGVVLSAKISKGF
jgi:hypothetical protein